MEVKPGYKQTEVGVIPEEWEVKSLIECARSDAPICYGILMPGEHINQGVPVVKVRDILGGRIDESSLLLTHPSIDAAYKRSRLCQGDVLITIRGTTGRVAIVTKELHGANITQDTARVRVASGESKEFIYYALQSQTVQQQVALHTIGQAVKGINIRDVKCLAIPLPDNLPEQRTLAEALSDVDRLLGALDQLIAKKRDLKQATMQQLLTGQTRLPGFRGGWATKLVGDVADVKTGPFGSLLHQSDYVRDGTPIITVEHLGECGVVHRNLPMVSDADRHRLRAFTLEAGDIVFSRVGSVDRNALIRDAEGGWLFSGRLLRVRPDRSLATGSYLSYQFHGEVFRRKVRDVAVGQTMASLNTQILKGIPILLPGRAEQIAIAAVLSDMDMEITALEERREKTCALKQGMMQELLTGHTRLV